MIYLFNSACKQSYFANVYRLVGKPAGIRQEVRYKEGQNAPPIATDRQYLGSECTICYVDRYADGGYRFHPFRKGKIRNISRAQGHAYYDIELAGHCHAASPADFTESFAARVEACPRLVDNDPESSEDGTYCVSGPDFDDQVKCADDSWARAIDQLFETFAFRFGAPAFVLTEVTRKDKPPRADELGFRMRAGADYRIAVLYRIANEREAGSKRKVRVRIGSEINHEFSIDSRSDRIEVPVKLPRAERSTSNITVTTAVDTEGSSGGNLDYSIDIPFRTRTRSLGAPLSAAIFAAVYTKHAWQSNWQWQNAELWLLAAAEFVPFMIVLWAAYRLVKATR